MIDGPLLFLAIGLGIVAAALLLARLLRRTARRKLPGTEEPGGTHWYPGSHRDGDGGDGE